MPCVRVKGYLEALRPNLWCYAVISDGLVVRQAKDSVSIPGPAVRFLALFSGQKRPRQLHRYNSRFRLSRNNSVRPTNDGCPTQKNKNKFLSRKWPRKINTYTAVYVFIEDNSRCVSQILPSLMAVTTTINDDQNRFWTCGIVLVIP